MCAVFLIKNCMIRFTEKKWNYRIFSSFLLLKIKICKDRITYLQVINQRMSFRFSNIFPMKKVCILPTRKFLKRILILKKITKIMASTFGDIVYRCPHNIITNQLHFNNEGQSFNPIINFNAMQPYFDMCPFQILWYKISDSLL